MSGEPLPSLIKDTTGQVTFENVFLNGKSVRSEAGIPLREGSVKIKNAIYTPSN